MEIITACKTTTPSRRISDMRNKGWIITKHKVSGKNYYRFFGDPPTVKKSDYIPKTKWVDLNKANASNKV